MSWGGRIRKGSAERTLKDETLPLISETVLRRNRNRVSNYISANIITRKADTTKIPPIPNSINDQVK